MAEKRGEQESNVVNKLVLKRAVEHKIKLISEKTFVSEREVYDLVRGFFKKYINIDYEFTADELLCELKKVYMPSELHERVNSMLNRVSEMEHVSRAFTKEELLGILADFKSVVDALIVTHYEKHGIFGKVKDSLNSTGKDHKKVLDEASLLNENERVIVKMNVLLDNARRWSEKDLPAAKKAYQELLALYNSLDDERKKAYYQPVQELYAILQSKG
jgi:hypothetical protein